MTVTLDSIKNKMGCDDPFNPPRNQHEEPLYIDEAKPSPYSVLTPEELAFLIEKETGINLLNRCNYGQR